MNDRNRGEENEFDDVSFSRRNHESIVVGDASRLEHVLKVTVLDVRGRQVKLGFEVPADMSIRRWEVLQRMRGGESDRGSFLAMGNW